MLRLLLSPWMVRSVAGLVVSATACGLYADDSVGVVRIRDRQAPVVRAQSPEAPASVTPVAGEQVATPANCEQTQPCAPAQSCGPVPCGGAPQPYCRSNATEHCPAEHCPNNAVECQEPGLCWHIKAHAIMAAEKARIRREDARRGMAYRHGAHDGSCPPGCPECERCRAGGCHDGWLRKKLGYFHCTGSCGQGTPLLGKYHMVYPVNPGYFDPRDGMVYSSQVFNTPVGVPLAPVVHHQYNYGWGVPSSRLTPVSHPVSPYGGAPIGQGPYGLAP
ncbi:hypothetical protein [Planctomyces sp. SH-PL14]|uniref:hypothetical protein n=1 Tax=Planctomyces sp. SH-PL14 TaxID=1632864 RepID=UPI00078CF828|nr:hypothetical protein [Planctomyces sp. SH-PL14]AMV21826.1 hypothetical protein VT03_28245 [Planctomyces sp. SH-PL14]